MTAHTGGNKKTNRKQVFVTVHRTSTRRQCRSFDTGMWMLLFVSVSLTLVCQRDIFDLHQPKMKLMKKIARPLCERRTYEYHFVQTHNFYIFPFFSFLMYILAITILPYIRVWHTHHSAHSAHDTNPMELSGWIAKSQSCFDVCHHSLVGPVSTENPLTHIELTARRQMKSICSGCRLLNENRFYIRRQSMCVTHSKHTMATNSDNDSLYTLPLCSKLFSSKIESDPIRAIPKRHFVDGPKINKNKYVIILSFVRGACVW